MSSPATVIELLTVLAARELAGRRIVFAGIGLPTLAAALAELTVAPDIEIIYESGVTGAHPNGLPTTISDSILVTGAEAVLPMPQLFGYVIQGQRIDTGFLGAAQIDRHGSLNSTLIGGSYARPEHRLPGLRRCHRGDGARPGGVRGHAAGTPRRPWSTASTS